LRILDQIYVSVNKVDVLEADVARSSRQSSGFSSRRSSSFAFSPCFGPPCGGRVTIQLLAFGWKFMLPLAPLKLLVTARILVATT
jgi:hypothetical protein